jgi:undecaprenyl-diphosphatase
MVLLGVIVAAILAWGRRWVFLGSWLAAVAGSAVLNHLLKVLFARPRPHFEHPLLVETSYSFPSGHAMESFVVYGMLAYFAVLALRSWESRGAALLVVLIGFSRMYLGVHYLSDVLAGYAAGGVWLSALITGTETIRRSKNETKPTRRTSENFHSTHSSE